MVDRKEIAEVMSKTTPKLHYDDIINYSGKIKIEQYNAGDIFIAPGYQSKALYFIKRGAVRAYFSSDDRDFEKTLYIRLENYYLADYYALLLDSPARLFYECIEDCIFYKFDFDELQIYMRQNPRVMAYGFDYMLTLAAEYLIRNEDFVFLSVEERYIKYVENNPEILRRIPEKHIASLLGITPVSLSRIKKRIQLRNE